MADLQPVIDAANKIEDVAQSATEVINGFAARMQAAVDKALENGATAEQLAPVVAEVDELNAKSQALADAIAANT